MALRLSVHVEMAATPERVYAVMTDLERARQWMPNLVSIEQLTGGSFGIGTRWRETRRVFGKVASEVFEVTGAEPGRSLDLYVDGTQGSSRRGAYRFRYDLSPAGDATLVYLHGEITGMNRVMELFGRLMLGSLRRAMAGDLHAMQRYIEHGVVLRTQPASAE
jgi:uncharacterized protein YndB with AHSA1/START domain